MEQLCNWTEELTEQLYNCLHLFIFYACYTIQTTLLYLSRKNQMHYTSMACLHR